MSSVNDFGSESVPSPSMPCGGPWGTVLLEVMTFTTGCWAGSKHKYTLKERRTATLFFSKSKNTLPVLWVTSSSQIIVNVQNAFHFCLGASRMSKNLCTLISTNISQNEKARNKSDLLESPCDTTHIFWLPGLCFHHQTHFKFAI